MALKRKPKIKSRCEELFVDMGGQHAWSQFSDECVAFFCVYKMMLVLTVEVEEYSVSVRGS